MIGIKIKNCYWEEALLNLLKDKAEIYQKNQNYSAILTDASDPNSRQSSIILEFLGEKHPLTLPLKKSALEALLAQIPSSYQNPLFIWISSSRTLTNKKTKKQIHLTEKEACLIDFLTTAPDKEATKQELLQNVWQYKKEADTHTIETTIYTLRQKLGKDANKLIVVTKTGYRLF